MEREVLRANGYLCRCLFPPSDGAALPECVMRLTVYTEYGLHALVHLARNDGRPQTARNIADAIGLPLNHVVKIVHALRRAGYLDTARGRIGGTRLACPASAITVGDVVRVLEYRLDLMACFRAGGFCVVSSVADCHAALSGALVAYLTVLDGYSIADLLP